MDRCPSCGGTLSISKAHMEFEGGTIPNVPIIAYNVLEMVCTNPKCDNYTADLSSPKIVISTIRQKMN